MHTTVKYLAGMGACRRLKVVPVSRLTQLIQLVRLGS
jgi:hypothetical protein